MSRSLGRLLSTRGVVIVAAVAIGLTVGTVLSTVAFASDSGKRAPAAASSTSWPTNAKGLTYGSAMRAVSPQDEPDLIQAEATNGKLGYVLRTDLEGQAPATPQEAIRLQKAQQGKDEVIPVYEADGITKIGVFVVTHGAGSLSIHP